MKGVPSANALLSAAILALGVVGCAARPSDAVRTVATGDRVRVWLEPTAEENPLVGDVDSIGPAALALDGSRIERGLPVAALAIGVGQDASDTGLVLGLLGSTVLSGWLQEKACSRIGPGELWLETP